MPIASVKSALSADEIVQAVESLDEDQLNRVVHGVMSVYARRHASPTAEREMELLKQIHQVLPASLWEEYRKLKTIRKEENLTPEQHLRLIELYKQIESDHVRRLTGMMELAQIRNKTLDEVMKAVGVVSSGYE